MVLTVGSHLGNIDPTHATEKCEIFAGGFRGRRTELNHSFTLGRKNQNHGIRTYHRPSLLLSLPNRMVIKHF